VQEGHDSEVLDETEGERGSPPSRRVTTESLGVSARQAAPLDARVPTP
jgi:hypothetical protein